MDGWILSKIVSDESNFPCLHSEVSIPGGVLLETDTMSTLDQLRRRWENLNKDQSTKLQLSLNSMEQDQLSPVHMTCITDLWIFLFIKECKADVQCCWNLFLGQSQFLFLGAGPPVPSVQSQWGV